MGREENGVRNKVPREVSSVRCSKERPRSSITKGTSRTKMIRVGSSFQFEGVSREKRHLQWENAQEKKASKWIDIGEVLYLEKKRSGGE